MMNRFVQFALACLLALALPVQGFAAQAMLFCAPVSSSSAPQDEQHVGSHDHHAQAADAHHAQQGDAQSSDTDLTKTQAHGKCSACASCCSAVALMGSLPSLAVMPLHQALSSSLPRGLERVMTGGIDRPPRLARL